MSKTHLLRNAAGRLIRLQDSKLLRGDAGDGCGCARKYTKCGDAGTVIWVPSNWTHSIVAINDACYERTDEYSQQCPTDYAHSAGTACSACGWRYNKCTDNTVHIDLYKADGVYPDFFKLEGVCYAKTDTFVTTASSQAIVPVYSCSDPDCATPGACTFCDNATYLEVSFYDVVLCSGCIGYGGYWTHNPETPHINAWVKMGDGSGGALDGGPVQWDIHQNGGADCGCHWHEQRTTWTGAPAAQGYSDANCEYTSGGSTSSQDSYIFAGGCVCATGVTTGLTGKKIIRTNAGLSIALFEGTWERIGEKMWRAENELVSCGWPNMSSAGTEPTRSSYPVGATGGYAIAEIVA